MELLVWNVHDLQREEHYLYQLSKSLQDLPSLADIGNFDSLVVGGKSKYVMLKFRSKDNAHYLIYNIKSGK